MTAKKGKRKAGKRAARSDRGKQKARRRPTTVAERTLEVQANQAEAPAPAQCNEKELAFIEFYIGEARFNGSKAIRLAGVHADPLVARVYASQWLNRLHVQAEILRRRDERVAQLQATNARLLEEQLHIALATIGDVVDWDELDVALTPKAELTPEQIAAIAKIDVNITETIKEARVNKEGVVTKPAEIRRVVNKTVAMHNKLEAIAALQKQLEVPPALRRRGINGDPDAPGLTIILEGGATGLEVAVRAA